MNIIYFSNNFSTRAWSGYNLPGAGLCHHAYARIVCNLCIFGITMPGYSPQENTKLDFIQEITIHCIAFMDMRIGPGKSSNQPGVR